MRFTRAFAWMVGVYLLVSGLAFAAVTLAVDPGVRGGAPGAGDLFPSTSSNADQIVLLGQVEFNTIQSVTEQPGHEFGLGPRFNGTSCGGCHSQPSIGGTSPFVNPQILMAAEFGGSNTIPFFITPEGPIREARFKRQPNGQPDGGVHDVFTIAGRTDAPGCVISQPDFDGAAASKNISFRIPTPVFGAGLLEAIPDRTIEAGAVRKSFGVNGRPNRNGNDGTTTRFGWKAQNKALDIFSAEAYNVEMGVTTDVFPQEREEEPSCLFNKTPENVAVIDEPMTVDAIGDQVRFAKFMQHLMPPAPAPDTDSTLAGRALFEQVGCSTCHTPTMKTGNVEKAYLANKDVNLFSDLLLHRMGPGLADGISQGLAGPDEFRTAPLWGVGQRIFFLHDGRTTDLRRAIEMHADADKRNNRGRFDRDDEDDDRDGRGGKNNSAPSEASVVVKNFRQLAESDKQHLLDFLRGL